MIFLNFLPNAFSTSAVYSTQRNAINDPLIGPADRIDSPLQIHSIVTVNRAFTERNKVMFSWVIKCEWDGVNGEDLLGLFGVQIFGDAVIK